MSGGHACALFSFLSYARLLFACNLFESSELLGDITAHENAPHGLTILIRGRRLIELGSAVAGSSDHGGDEVLQARPKCQWTESSGTVFSLCWPHLLNLRSNGPRCFDIGSRHNTRMAGNVDALMLFTVEQLERGQIGNRGYVRRRCRAE